MRKKTIINIAPYFIIALMSMIILAKPFGSGDELWNYSFAKNISEGMVPYRDFNIVQTPLSAYIPAFFMALFGRGLFIHRLVGLFLLFAITAVCYHLCKKVTGSIFIGLITSLFVACVCLPFYIYNYNYLSAFIILVIFEIEQLQKKESMGWNILVGLLVGILILVKQNTGFMLILANLVVCIINVLKFKMDKKIQIARVCASMIPGAIFVVYMLITGAFNEFIDYAVVGVSTFVHRSTIIDLIAEAPFFVLYIAFIVFAYGYMLISIRKNGATPTQLAGLLFASAWLMITYPLFDSFHLVCVYIVLAPVFLMFVKPKRYKLVEKCVCMVVVLAVSLLSVIAFLPSSDDDYVVSTLNNYENILIDRKANENMGIVIDYIKQKTEEGYRVRITDDSAIAYKVPLDEYEKNWDMLLVGNIGTNSVEDLLETPDKCLYLVYKYTDALGSQDHFEIIEYIKQNYAKVEEVLSFDVYEEP